MSEPIQGTPAPANNPQGTGQQPEQPQPTAPNPAQPSPQPNPPAAPPDIAALQQKLEQAEKAARHYQSQFSQARNQLQAVTGIQPQVDPLEAKAEAYAKQFGFDPKDTKNFLAMMQAEVAPLAQRNQQLEAMVQGSARVDAVMQAAQQQDPTLFQDERVYREVYEGLRQSAMTGNTQNLTPEYAISYGDGVWGSIHRRAQLNPNTPPPPAPRLSMSWNGPPGGYVPAPAPGPRQAQPNSYDAELAERFNIKKQ